MVVTKSRNPVTVLVTWLVRPDVANFLSQSKSILDVDVTSCDASSLCDDDDDEGVSVDVSPSVVSAEK